MSAMCENNYADRVPLCLLRAASGVVGMQSLQNIE